MTELTIEVWMAADEFKSSTNREAMAGIDAEGSYRNFERLLTEEIKKFYPTADVAVHVSSIKRTTICLDHEDIAWTAHPASDSAHANIYYAMDKVFFYGRFWVNQQP
jgi:hypothetical protein